MAVAVESTGTQTAVVGTLHTLAAPTTAKTRVLVVDLSAMLAGDVVEIGLQRKVLSAGAVLTWLLPVFAGPVGQPVLMTIPLPSPFGATFTLKQTAGAARAFPFSVETID